MKTLCKHILTGKDNKTAAISRVLLVGSILQFQLLSAFDILHSGHFDYVSWCSSVSILLFGGGAGINMTAKTEPEPGS